MSEIPSTFKLAVIDEQGVKNYNSVTSISINTINGEITALAGHIGTTVIIEPSSKIDFRISSEKHQINISSGFAQITSEEVKIITNSAEITS